MPIDLNTPTIRPPTALDLDPAAQELQTATGETGSLLSDLNAFSKDTLAAPSRYDIPLVQQGMDLINAEHDDGTRRGMAAMDEQSSSRGLVGSNIEAWNTKDMLTDLERVRSQKLFDLGNVMAQTQGADRASAANMAAMAANLGLGHQQFLQSLSQRETEFNATTGIQQDQFATSMAQRESEFARTYGLSQSDIDLRRDALMQEATLSNRSMDITEATQQAELDLRADQLLEERRQFDQSYTLEEAQFDAQREEFDRNFSWSQERFAQELGLSQQQLDLSREEMDRTFADRDAERYFTAEQSELSREFSAAENELNRLQQLGLQAGDQAFDAAQAELDRIQNNEQFQSAQQFEQSMTNVRFQNTLELQNLGYSFEEAQAEADRMLEQQLQQNALALEATGMNLDEAYRRAALNLEEQQSNMDREQREQVQNQEAALAAWDIYMRALSFGDGSQLDFPTLPGVGDFDFSQFFGSMYSDPNDPTRNDPTVDNIGYKEDPTGERDLTDEEVRRRQALADLQGFA